MSAAPKLLRLRALDVEDLTVVSAMVQDALVPVGDIGYQADIGRFLLALNRFCWETARDRAHPGERVHAGLRFERVRGVRFRGINRHARGRILSLLALAYDSADCVMLHFAEGATIQLRVDALDCALEDLDEPWPAQRRPSHDQG